MKVTNTLTGETAVLLSRTWGATAATDAWLIKLGDTITTWLVSETGTPTYS